MSRDGTHLLHNGDYEMASMNRTSGEDEDGSRTPRQDDDRPGSEPHSSSSWRESYKMVLLVNFIAEALHTVYQNLMYFEATQSERLARREELARPPHMDPTFDFITGIGQGLAYGIVRAAWVTIGDRSSRSVKDRLALTHALVGLEFVLALLLAVGMIVFGPENFVNDHIGAVGPVLEACARALDRPEVPVIMAFVKMSSFGPYFFGHEIGQIYYYIVQLIPAMVGLLYLNWSFRGGSGGQSWKIKGTLPSPQALRVLAYPVAIFACFALVQDLVRGMFQADLLDQWERDSAKTFTIAEMMRTSLLYSGLFAIEATAATFVSHAWGNLRKQCGVDNSQPKVAEPLLQAALRPVYYSTMLALITELLSGFSLFALFNQPFTEWAGRSDAMNAVVSYLSTSIGWTYMFQAMSTQLAVLLYTTRPTWYLYQMLILTVAFLAPLMTLRKAANFDPEALWHYETWVLGASNVLGFLLISGFVWIWGSALRRGRMRVDTFVPMSTRDR